MIKMPKWFKRKPEPANVGDPLAQVAVAMGCFWRSRCKTNWSKVTWLNGAAASRR